MFSKAYALVLIIAFYTATTGLEDIKFLETDSFSNILARTGTNVNCTKTYTVYNKTLSWVNALHFCKNVGGYLSILTSTKEDNHLQSMINNLPAPVWLGIHALYAKGDWTSVTGKNLSEIGYRRWYTNAVTNSEKYQCMALRQDGRGMDTYACSTQLFTVCETSQ